MEIRKLTSIFTIFILGFQASLFQVIAFRKIFSLVGVNKLFTSIFMFIWLVGTGLGVLIGNWQKKKNWSLWKELIFNLLAGFFLLGVFRFYKFFDLVPGEIPSLNKIFYLLSIILLPISIGFGYTLVSILDKDFIAILNLDVLGGIISGFFTTYLLYYWNVSDNAFWVIFFFLSLLRFLSLFFDKIFTLKRILSVIFLALTLVFLSRCLFFEEEIFFKKHYKGLWKVKDTYSGQFVCTRLGQQKNIFYNGQYLYTYPDEYQAKEFIYSVVYYNLLKNEDRKFHYFISVLLIGGDIIFLPEKFLDLGALMIDYVTPCREFINFSFKIFPQLKTLMLKIQKTKKKKEIAFFDFDPIFLLRNIPIKYSYLLMDVGLPYDYNFNKYYTVEFFQMLRNSLEKDGILGIALPGGEGYISPSLQKFLTTVYLSLKKVFPYVGFLPGKRMYFIASLSSKRVPVIEDILQGRLNFNLLPKDKAEEIESFFLKYNFYRFNIWIKRLSQYKVPLNTMWQPVGYLYTLSYLESKFGNSTWEKLLDYKWLVLTCLLLFLLLMAYLVTKEFFSKEYLISFLAGGWGITFFLLFLVVFQYIMGDLYLKIGLLFSLYFLGYYLALFKLKDFFSLRGIFYGSFYLLFSVYFIFFKFNLGKDFWNYRFYIEYFFYFSVFLIGFLASRTFFQLQQEFKDKAKLYFFDLLGSAIFSLLFLVLLPLIGALGILLMLLFFVVLSAAVYKST